jgi:hypothetical protein
MTMMLATLSHSMPPAFQPSPAPAPTLNTDFAINMNMTTALPIIPRGSAPPQRPKLSVNTAQPRSFGKGASLRLDTLSAVSPTRINTFSNAYPTLDRPAKPRLSVDSSIPNAPSAASASTLSATPSSASTTAATTPIPYKQPHNVASILANSPLRSIIPRKMAASRPMFPAEKRVSWSTPLEEDITTVKYTLAHSDLNASVSTLSSLSTIASSASSESNTSAMHHSIDSASTDKAASSSVEIESPPRAKHPRAGDKRESSSEDDSDSAPETPVAGRRKRTRDWRWTLGPVSVSDKAAATSSSSSSSIASDAATSEDSS